MQDREVVAAVVAADPDGLAAAYDQFAAPLFAYCRRMLPDPEAAAGAVRDTFVIATSRLEGLRDPDRLRAWLYAVARNECLRRQQAAGVTSRPPKVTLPAPGAGAPAAIELPDELRGQVLRACTDNTPAGRADRASVTHRAGSFGPTGFPKAIGAPGPLWWRRIRRHPRAATAVIAVAAVAAVAAGGIVVMLTAGSPHHTQVSTLALGGGVPAGATGVASSSAAASPSATHRASPANSRPAPSVSASAGVPSPDPPIGRESPPPSASAPGTPPSSSPLPSPSSPPSSSSPSPTPTPTPTPGRGTLKATPAELKLTSTAGKAVSGTFILSAVGGPVRNYTISVPAGMAAKVKVSPAAGSLPGDGWVTVTVTVTSKVAVGTRLTVDPGNIAVTVALSIKA
jgi:Sigma-70 region 2